MKKTLLFLIIALCAILALSACNKNPSSDTGSDSSGWDAYTNEATAETTDPVTAAGDNSVSEDADFTGAVLENGYYITGYNGNAEQLMIPESLDGETVVGIDTLAFSSCETMREVVFSSQIKTVSEKAFYGSKNLERVVLNDGLDLIERDAFSDCPNLKEVVLPNTVSKIENSAFARCANLSEIVLPESIKEIGWTSFAATAISSIRIPAGVAELGYNVFQACSELTDVYVENPNIEMADNTFSECPNVILHSTAGSNVEAYANEHSIPFVAD